MRGIVVGGLDIMVSRVLLRLMRCLSSVMGFSVMRVLVMWLLVVDNLVVLGVITGVAIVVIHLEDKVAFFNIDLA